MKLSIVLPALNEAHSIGDVLRRVREVCVDAELIVVNDGSTDDTAPVAAAAGARVISHPYGIGNGGTVKAGARAAEGDVLVFVDADGQHDPADIPRLLALLAEGYDMVVGARDQGSQATAGRAVANGVYNRLASLMTGHRVQDLTSGFRAVRAARFRKFLSLLANGFLTRRPSRWPSSARATRSPMNPSMPPRASAKATFGPCATAFGSW